VFLLAPCVALLCAAAILDVATRRVPNLLVGALAVSGLGAQWLVRGHGTMLLAVLAVGIAGAVHAIPWWLRVLGGGDVKLAAAAAAWVGAAALPTFLLAAAVAGGLVSAAALLAGGRWSRAALSPRLSAGLARISPSARTGISVPYGVAISAGAIVALGWGA
jgi:prepilin peptidase CpaA